MEQLSPQFFLSNLSHEIRTPLNGIVGYTQLLSQTKLDNNQKLYINSMNQCCIQLVELVNDILDYSKLAMDKVSLNKECFSLNEVFEDVYSTLGYRIKEKRQVYNRISEGDIPNYIIGDKQKLTQILINLVSNANKFTDNEGRIIVCVSIKPNNILQFSVEDNGIGISEKEQKLLFNPFYQVQETKNGSGLGLVICKKLIELHGGRIWVDSNKGEGTIFTFTIKYDPYEEFEKYIQKYSSILRNKYVLIIDSDIDSRLSASELFFDYGMFPIVCSSDKEALRLILNKRYDFSVVFIDESYELAKKIKEINYEIPIIIASIESRDSEFEKNIIQKPINKFKLIDVITRIINKNDIKQFQLNPLNNKIVKETHRFLIAEDISYNSDILLKMLNSMGYNDIDIAEDGEKALQMLDVKQYDILLLDLKMPKIDGFQVAKQNKSEHLQIIVITASVLESDKEKCKELGIKYFLLKPFNITHLKTIINKIIH